MKETKNPHFTYSPDATTTSISLLTDTRNAGLKKDLTYALYNEETAEGMPLEFKNNFRLIDTIKDSNGERASGNGQGGFCPLVKYLREYAQTSGENKVPVLMLEHGAHPVISQVQAGIHAAIEITNGSQFQVYFSVFPSVTMWNPYNVPIKIDKTIKVSLRRRGALWTGYRGAKLRANYTIGDPHSSSTKQSKSFDVFGNSDWSTDGWSFTMYIDPNSAGNQEIVIPPGKAMIFSPHRNIKPTSSRNFRIDLHPGWSPGTGQIFKLDGLVHDANDYSSNGSFPKLSIGVGAGDYNVEWTAQVDNQIISNWARIRTTLKPTSLNFFNPPTVNTLHQDVVGGFPAILYKFSLRMGDDYLPVHTDENTNFVHPDQKTLLFPYVANLITFIIGLIAHITISHTS